MTDAARHTASDKQPMQDEFWHLRHLTLSRLAMTPTQRVDLNSEIYEFWRWGQENKARAIAARRAAERDGTT